MECLPEESEVTSGEVPAVWKVASVTAIYKKGTREKPRSSRPV